MPYELLVQQPIASEVDKTMPMFSFTEIWQKQ